MRSIMLMPNAYLTLLTVCGQSPEIHKGSKEPSSMCTGTKEIMEPSPLQPSNDLCSSSIVVVVVVLSCLEWFNVNTRGTFNPTDTIAY